jgi:transcriptional regulator with XRE-family HTH domain
VQTPGQRLRSLREQLGLSIRDVEMASHRIAKRRLSDEYAINLSRLSDIETKGVVPSVFRFYTLAAIYRRDILELLSWYGIDLQHLAADEAMIEPPKSHLAQGVHTEAVRMPVRLDPAFDLRKTTNMGRMVERWGIVPLAYLAQFENTSYSYGYIGTEDLSMYPLLMPGSFVQIDESRNRVQAELWRSEYERPIFFVETRNSFACSWCALEGDRLVLQPHPLSPQSTRVFKYPQEADVVGQVVGVAMRLGEWKAMEPSATSRARLALT